MNDHSFGFPDSPDARAGTQPASEADFTLDDLLLPGEFAGPGAPAQFGGVQPSIFDEGLPAVDGGSDFLRDYQVAPVVGSNIFGDPPGAGPDGSAVGFDRHGLFDLGDSLSGAELDQSSQASNELLEELDRPFPDAPPSGSDPDDADPDGVNDVLSAFEPAESCGPGSTLFSSGIRPIPARYEDGASAVSFELPAPAAGNWHETKPATATRAGAAPPQVFAEPVAAEPASGVWSPAAPEPAAPARRWLRPAAGAIAGAAATAAAFTLAGSPTPPPAVAPPAAQGVDARELALAESRSQADEFRRDAQLALEAERRRADSASESIRTAADKQLAAERERVRQATGAARLAEAARTRSEAALALVSAELSEFKVRPDASAQLLAEAQSELAASRATADAARREVIRAEAAARDAERARSDAERQLAELRAGRAAAELKLAEANRARERAGRSVRTRPAPPPPSKSAVATPPAADPDADPEAAQALLAAGLESYSAGRVADAERQLTEAAARGADARAWYFLGFARYRQGQDPTPAFARGVELERQGRPPARQVVPLLEGVDRAARAALSAVR